DDAGVAADAGGEVDRHAPAVAGVGDERIERRLQLRALGLLVEVALERGRAHDVAPLHALVVLRGGERMALARRADLEPGGEAEPVGEAERGGVEARPRAPPAPPPAAAGWPSPPRRPPVAAPCRARRRRAASAATPARSRPRGAVPATAGARGRSPSGRAARRGPRAARAPTSPRRAGR